MEHENVDELLREFVIERNENLETIDRPRTPRPTTRRPPRCSTR